VAYFELNFQFSRSGQRLDVLGFPPQPQSRDPVLTPRVSVISSHRT